MAARKLQNEIEKCFKKVSEGVQQFESVYEKIQQATNPAQKEKLEDALKKEIKKLQRSRDQIKAWAASNEIKDKKALLEQRKLIETQMEKFKAVEKEMKTKAYSKEGLQAAAKLDPKEREKAEVCEFLSRMVDELERQIEQTEAEAENIIASIKKGKKDTAKSERAAALERLTERHKWHQSRLELMWRSLENGGLDVEQVKELEEEIKYYVEENRSADFVENEEIYDELDLQDEEDLFGMVGDTDRVSSQDTQSLADDLGDDRPIVSGKQKSTSISDISAPSARRPSTQLKSPLPALATLHAPLPTSNGSSAAVMKPAPPPARAEPLKYASAAAAAAAGEQNELGVAALPAPPGSKLAAASPAVTSASLKSPTVPPAQPVSAPSSSSSASRPVESPAPPAPVKAPPAAVAPPTAEESKSEKGADDHPLTPALTNGDTHSDDEDEPIYHLPASLEDLVSAFEAAKSAASRPPLNPDAQRLFAAGAVSFPESVDAERPMHYRPQNPYPYTPSHYPQEPLGLFDDARLYTRVDGDTLFYAFYYRQGTYQQYLAAKALKAQSWRFHKQYQTWFQRHEEPKSITEDYEQGTYRFFDYESTWMNRRKADFKFHYRWLEDDL